MRSNTPLSVSNLQFVRKGRFHRALLSHHHSD
jgi:hypothetical protein